MIQIPFMRTSKPYKEQTPDEKLVTNVLKAQQATAVAIRGMKQLTENLQAVLAGNNDVSAQQLADAVGPQISGSYGVLNALNKALQTADSAVTLKPVPEVKIPE